MAVTRYKLSLLQLDSYPVIKSPSEMIDMLKIWRKHHEFATVCSACHSKLKFQRGVLYTLCCHRFYYDAKPLLYSVQSIAVPTPGFEFLIPQLKKMIAKHNIRTDQDFLILPDPVFWQVVSTLDYEKAMKFVSRQPVTTKSTTVMPSSRTDHFYTSIQETPLNYGSLQRRSCGKATLIRQAAFGKRCQKSMRGMIVPDASLKPNEIRLPHRLISAFKLAGKWIVLNRMPSLQPGNFVALRVHAEGWPYPCFGIPLEIVEAINGDFDGDECNVYMVENFQSQAEVGALLDSRAKMGCFVMGLKLAPSQDMLAAYYLFYDEIHFLPYKERDLRQTFQVIYDLYGSDVTFQCFDKLRLFYLDAFQKRMCFALTLEEMLRLFECGQRCKPFIEEFEKEILGQKGCLVTQVVSGAKGSIEHLYQMFGSIGWQDGVNVNSCYWQGLTPLEGVAHAQTSNEALKKTGNIWEPGYGYSKIVHNLQGLYVNYLGNLMDGDVMVERDVLDAVHHTDIMSEAAFKHLIESVLKKKGRKRKNGIEKEQ